MKRYTFLCVGGDMRQTYMSRKLTAYGDVYTYGIVSGGGNVTVLDELVSMPCMADILVLPMMKGDGLEIDCKTSMTVSSSEIIPYLKKDALVIGGRLSTIQIEYFSALGYDVIDYFKREELVIKNCVPTAEGALQLAMQESGRTIYGSRVLVTGYGRVAKYTAKLFASSGAEVTVSARKLSALAEAENNGLFPVHNEEIYGFLPKFEIIINTIPTMIFDKDMLEAVSEKALIIDLASNPGGVDFESAKEQNKRVIWALSLPGKVAPVTSGEIIADTIRNILQERGKQNAYRKD